MLEPPRPYTLHTITEIARCVVVRVGSRRFAVLEPPRTSAKAP